MSDFAAYYPYDRPEDEKCVSLINGTKTYRSEFQSLHGKRVVVSGVALRYDDLPGGPSQSDRLLSKKYYQGDVVENFCLRDFVFVVHEVVPQ